MKDFLNELRWRGLLNDCTPDLEDGIAKGEVHTAYVGFDPTAPSLTIGNLVSLMLLVHWQRAGGKAIVLLGGATGRIGDPSFKAEERQLMSYDLLDKNFTTSYIKLRLKHQRLLDNFNFQEDITAWEEEFFEDLEFLKELNIVNGEYFINSQIKAGKRVLAEGAQGSMLDIDFGTFPYVTSSNTISAGVCSGLGIAPQQIRDVIGVTKAYCTRVGSGPFPTELDNEIGEELRKIGSEFGATTGRPRRCGWIDLVALRFACMINGVTKIVMTKADVLDPFKELQVCTDYKINGKENKMRFTFQLYFPLLEKSKKLSEEFQDPRSALPLLYFFQK